MARVEIEQQILFFSFGFARISEVRHIYICLYLTQFLSIAVAITKWVHNPFTNDAIAIAIGHHVNSLIWFHTTHSWQKKIVFRCRCRLSVNRQ